MQAIRASLQKCIPAVFTRLKALDVSVLTEKMSSLLNRHRGRSTSSSLFLFFDGKRVTREKKRHYFGMVIDDRLTWRPVVAKVIAVGRKVLSILRKFGDQSWGGLEGSQLLLYHGLVGSRRFHVLPLLSLSQAHCSGT